MDADHLLKLFNLVSPERIRKEMERDDNVAELFDRADNDAAYEHAAQLEREHDLYQALEACVKAGLSKEHLRTLRYETGMTMCGPLNDAIKGK